MKREYMIVRKIANFPVTAVLAATIAIVCLAIGFAAGALASSENFHPDKYLILPEHSETFRPHISPPHKYLRDHEWSYEDFDAEVECLAKNIYFESRDQDIQGQIAVGLVTINRVMSSNYPNSICEVVWEKRRSRATGKMVAHFSWTLDGKPDVPLDEHAWEESQRLAEAMLAGRSLYNFHDFTDGSDHYHADYVDPPWSKTLTRTIIVGDHLFYISSPVALTQ